MSFRSPVRGNGSPRQSLDGQSGNEILQKPDITKLSAGLGGLAAGSEAAGTKPKDIPIPDAMLKHVVKRNGVPIRDPNGHPIIIGFKV